MVMLNLLLSTTAFDFVFSFYNFRKFPQFSNSKTPLSLQGLSRSPRSVCRKFHPKPPEKTTVVFARKSFCINFPTHSAFRGRDSRGVRARGHRDFQQRKNLAGVLEYKCYCLDFIDGSWLALNVRKRQRLSRTDNLAQEVSKSSRRWYQFFTFGVNLLAVAHVRHGIPVSSIFITIELPNANSAQIPQTPK